MTLDTTKKALTAATKAFAKLPSATNWKALEAAMYAHQEAHQQAQVAAMYVKVISQPYHNA